MKSDKTVVSYYLAQILFFFHECLLKDSVVVGCCIAVVMKSVLLGCCDFRLHGILLLLK